MNKYVNITKKIVLIISLIIYIYLVFIGRNQYIYNISYNNLEFCSKIEQSQY